MLVVKRAKTLLYTNTTKLFELKLQIKNIEIEIKSVPQRDTLPKVPQFVQCHTYNLPLLTTVCRAGVTAVKPSTAGNKLIQPFI